MHPVPANVLFALCTLESLIMATGSHVGSHAEVHRLKQAQPHDLLKRMVCSGDEKNMREVSEESVQKCTVVCKVCLLSGVKTCVIYSTL